MSEAPLTTLAAAVRPVDAAAAAACRAHWDRLTKPTGSLGHLEALAARLAAVAGAPTPAPGPALALVAAADHGVAAEGVSAYPQAVTVEMIRNLRAGGAGANVLARQAGARLLVLDAGSLAGPAGEVAELPPLAPGGAPVMVRRVCAGTASFARRAAMRRDQVLAAVAAGAEAVAWLAEEVQAGAGAGLPQLALGELGIGNTTVTAALAAVLLGLEPGVTVGPGTGLDRAGLARKREVVARALGLHRPDPGDPVGTLAAVGGPEFAALVGATLAAAARGWVVVLDGSAVAVAALLACRLAPAVGDYLVAGTLSPEPAHAPALAALGLKPLLDLGLRLGEGSGALAALPLIRQTLAVGREMATFEAAGVSDRC